ncbi:NAD-P-binding protein [Trametes gibbosa]|nr:NAD-P-binding protein [Trametes gibbosa]
MSRTRTTWLVTGANRGIGFEFVRQLLESSTNLVVAACRNPEMASTLSDLREIAQGTLHIIKIDVSDFDSIRSSVPVLEQILGETGLDYLVNNAAIAIIDTAFAFEPEALLSSFRTNTIGPALLSQVCLPLLEKGHTKKIVHISSISGSIASLAQTPSAFLAIPSYSMSKIALNMLAYKQKLERPDITIIPLCPGWVRTETIVTDMGGQDAAMDMEGGLGGQETPLEPHESVSKMLKLVTSSTIADSAKFVRWNGETIPW